MELALAVIALVAAGIALGLVLQMRTGVSGAVADARAARGELEQTRRDVARLTDQLARLSSDLEAAQRELADLKAATEVVPVPPLPKTRPGGLDDLREQLRAAHREEGEASAEE